MKNAIEYFYKLRPVNIHQNKDEYFFEVDKKYYSLKECNRSIEEINELYNLQQELYQRNIYLHQFIWNSNRELITIINEKKYILMRLFIIENRKITLQDIINLNNIKVIGNYQNIKRNNWRNLWMQKMDYIEYQIEENKVKCKNFSLNVDYFIGLAENAIQLLYGIDNNELYLVHQRIDSNMRVKDLFNPLNIVLDSKARNISEYIKEKIIRTGTVNDELWDSSVFMDLGNVHLKLLFIRCLFITQYFDLFDQVLFVGYENIENEVDAVLNGVYNYELFIRKLYDYLYNRQIIPDIEWLKKTSF